jgi:hypothetical protein
MRNHELVRQEIRRNHSLSYAVLGISVRFCLPIPIVNCAYAKIVTCLSLKFHLYILIGCNLVKRRLTRIVCRIRTFLPVFDRDRSDWKGLIRINRSYFPPLALKCGCPIYLRKGSPYIRWSITFSSFLLLSISLYLTPRALAACIPSREKIAEMTLLTILSAIVGLAIANPLPPPQCPNSPRPEFEKCRHSKRGISRFRIGIRIAIAIRV